MNWILRLLSISTVGLILCSCALDVSPKSFIHQDSETKELDTTALLQAVNRAEAKISLTPVSLTNAQGILLSGVIASYPEPIVNIVFYAANGMTINNASALLAHFSRIPANILWVDYQGTGASEKAKKLQVAHLQADALQVFDYASKVFENNLPVVLHGLSMGSLLATYVAQNRSADGLVLDGAIGSVPDLVGNVVPPWSKPFTSVKIHPDLLKMNNVTMLSTYTGPLMLLVGEKDKKTPLVLSESLFAQSPSSKKELVVVPGATHGNNMKTPLVVDQYRRFVAGL
ncbi:alpha/beta hydrolase [Alteromonas aestuariivivens]|uniref:Alpha/beta hydrolase n=1 Tax=Alteromonas aestuariivivens TaxID=1938339 RepID=A0A3D8M750_9ALTE|nr:alpha/beta hydrolase [Alteromonas aestuariivivens]RDV25548.1 alpha/beta hydrolase [Alteromonas aestuariivivens]